MDLHKGALLAVAVTAAAFAWACGPSGTEVCGPANCTGCCDSTGTCQSGVTDLSCGFGGGSCTPCPSGLLCSAGACVPPGTCGGCVHGTGTCRMGNDFSACGRGGATCKVCTTDQVCLNGECRTGCRDEGMPCADDLDCCIGRCSAVGVCESVLPDGGTDAGHDGGETTDGGEVTDGGAWTDGGQTMDGGLTTDGGHATDGGHVSDGGHPMDGGVDGGATGPCGDVCLPSAAKDPACGDPCVMQVCLFASQCCQIAWDLSCVFIADLLCQPGCIPDIDGGFPIPLDGGTPPP